VRIVACEEICGLTSQGNCDKVYYETLGDRAAELEE
jgi:hypothetical protein